MLLSLRFPFISSQHLSASEPRLSYLKGEFLFAAGNECFFWLILSSVYIVLKKGYNMIIIIEFVDYAIRKAFNYWRVECYF